VSQSQNVEEALYAAAAQLPATERASFLRENCPGDERLRSRIESRFATQIASASMEATVLDDETIGSTLITGGVHPRAPEEALGDSIGRYTLIEKIGEGGCGVVYLAEQREPIKRQVALKITKLGMDTKQVVARFEAERQALAMMEHPHIASVIDGGATVTGRPFFVMELVRGKKITEYCDEHKLSTRKRLRLFIQVCHAIEHAHQKGILHRDIKPSNILVSEHDGVPVCKVIDFGIAKATQGTLSDKTIYTQVDQFMGTPAYMSPEQAAMGAEELDARTDIYSLGVLLYELLTGYTPFGTKSLLERGFDEMRRIIREIEPMRPSSRVGTQAPGDLNDTTIHRSTDAPRLVNIIRGDLDWIVMKCLEKASARRYSSVAELSQEIERFLVHQPVMARPPSKLYLLQKLILRNRLAFGAGGVFFGTLIAGLCVTTYYVIKEHDSRLGAERAVQSAEVARKTAVLALDEANADRQKAEDARLKAVAALVDSEQSRSNALASARVAEDARKNAEEALRQAEEERQKAEASAELARQSKSAEDAARSEATNAVSKSEESARLAALEADLRQRAETARSQAEAERVQAVGAKARADSARAAAESAAANAQAETVKMTTAFSNLLAGLDTLPASQAVKTADLLPLAGHEMEPWAPALLRHRAEWKARAGDWDGALQDFSRVADLHPAETGVRSAVMVLLLQAGKVPDYNRLRGTIAAFITATNHPAETLNLATGCLLAPEIAPPEAIESIRRAIESVTNRTDPGRWEMALGLTDFRRGRYADAVEGEGKAAAVVPEKSALRATALAIQAMAQEQLHQTNEAASLLDKAAEIYGANVPKPPAADFGTDWRDWVMAKILVQEAVGCVGAETATSDEKRQRAAALEDGKR